MNEEKSKLLLNTIGMGALGGFVGGLMIQAGASFFASSVLEASGAVNFGGIAYTAIIMSLGGAVIGAVAGMFGTLLPSGKTPAATTANSSFEDEVNAKLQQELASNMETAA